MKYCPFCDSRNVRKGSLGNECLQCGTFGPLDDSKWDTRPVEEALLSACETFVAAMEEGMWDDLKAAREQARDAIARAKGEP